MTRRKPIERIKDLSMKMKQVKSINLAIMAHVDAGKTTVTEEFLYHSGAKDAAGNVDKGTTTTDSLTLEKEKGITIRLATVSFEWRGKKINLIDTPGHMDFIAEVERTFSVLDGVVLVISAKEGVQPQTQAIYTKLKKMNIPIIFFINKIDRLGVNPYEIKEQIAKELSKDCIYMQEVVENEQYMLEVHSKEYTEEYITSQLIPYSERIYNQYFEEGSNISSEEIYSEIFQLVQSKQAYPVYFGSALKDIGMDELLDAVITWFDTSLEDEREVHSQKEYFDYLDENLSAYVYKIEWIGKHQRKAYVRIYSGGLRFKQRVQIYGTDTSFVVNHLYELRQGHEVGTGLVIASDICVIYCAQQLKCGQWLGTPIKRDGLSHELNPLLSVRIRAHNPEKRIEVMEALHELEMEEPYLSIQTNEREITMRLFGRLQKEYIEHSIMERYHLGLDFDEIKIIKRETPIQKMTTSIWMGERFEDAELALLDYPFNRYEAGIELCIEPLAAGSGIVYESKVSYGDLEKSFQNAVQEGVMVALQQGLMNEVVDTKVTFTDMQYSSVTSTPSDFRDLAFLVVKRVLSRAGVRLIMPYMTYIVRVPLGFEKYITSKLCELHAIIMDSTFTESEAIYQGEVALEEVRDFALDITMYTKGKGSFELEFLEYR